MIYEPGTAKLPHNYFQGIFSTLSTRVESKNYEPPSTNIIFINRSARMSLIRCMDNKFNSLYVGTYKRWTTCFLTSNRIQSALSDTMVPFSYLRVSLKCLVLPSSSSKKVSSGILHLTYMPAVTGTLRNFFCNCGARLEIL